LLVKEGEGSLCGHNFNLHIVVLTNYAIQRDLEQIAGGRTDSSSEMIKGALIDATLPVVMSRTCI
jgi:hypothetical protein